MVVSEKTFCAQLDFINRNFVPISLDTFLSGQVPKNACLLTFDDGYRDFLEVAHTQLKARGFPSVIFVNASSAIVPQEFSPLDQWYLIVERWWNTQGRSHGEHSLLDELINGRKRIQYRNSPPTKQINYLALLSEELHTEPPNISAGQLYLDEDDILELSSRGVEIGAHSFTHHLLTTLTPAEAHENILGCYSWLKRLMRNPPRVFAYPAGALDAKLTNMVREAGFIAAFEARDKQHMGDLYQLPRQHMHERGWVRLCQRRESA